MAGSSEGATEQRQIAVIGAGPAGLMVADLLAADGHAVTIYDRMASAGRKFLMAGRGGLNLTHSEPLDRFMQRYGEAAQRLAPLVEAFPPEALRAWCEALGQPTFVGSSGRVFPESFKASPLLRAWLARLGEHGARLVLRHRWTGWDAEGRLRFALPDESEIAVRADATVLALGGASWPRLGSDGGWAEALRRAGIVVAPFRPANCGFTTAWSDLFRDRFEGQPLKPIALSFGGQTIRGEAIVTRQGLEGGAVYALASLLRDAIEREGEALLSIDLRPGLDETELARRLDAPRGSRSLSTHLRKAAGLSPVAIALLREAAEPDAPSTQAALATRIKSVKLRLTGTRPIERAISTAGGIALDELDDRLMLRRMPGVFAAGEMLDWEAPTGGYLLQATFSTAVRAAAGVRDWLGNR